MLIFRNRSLVRRFRPNRNNILDFESNVLGSFVSKEMSHLSQVDRVQNRTRRTNRCNSPLNAFTTTVYLEYQMAPPVN